MSYEINSLKQKVEMQLAELNNQIKIDQAANAFVLSHLIKALNEKHPEEDLLKDLKNNIELDMKGFNRVSSSVRQSVNKLLRIISAQ